MRHPEEDDMEDCSRCDGWGYLDKTTGRPMDDEDQRLFPDYAKACPRCGGRGKTKRVGKKLLIGGR